MASTSKLDETIAALAAKVTIKGWRIDELEEKLDTLEDKDQTVLDHAVAYRNLAIFLGAKPDQMLDAYDKSLCEGGTMDSDTIDMDGCLKSWKEMEKLEAEAVTRDIRIQELKAEVATLLVSNATLHEQLKGAKNTLFGPNPQ